MAVRVDQADQSIEDALVALSRAIYLLGLSEGKRSSSTRAGVVAESRRLLHQHGMAPFWAADYTSRSCG